MEQVVDSFFKEKLKTKSITESEIQKILDKLKKKNKDNDDQAFSFIDLFAGIGGIRIPFENLGGKCVFTSEWDKAAQQTYFCNFGEMPEGDIRKISNSDIPDHNILLAGFPCQAFSVAGERKGFKDTRGTLFFEIARILEAKKPQGFLLENVKGLLSHRKGQTFKRMEKILTEELGYQVYYKVLNTMDYSDLPQTRERVYIVGIRAEIQRKKGVPFEFPEKNNNRKLIVDILEKEKVDKRYYYDRFGIYPTLKKEIKRIDTIYQWRRVYVRENKSNVCPTLTANMGTGGHNVPLLKDNYGIRKLTPRECLNLQGFPKSYHLPSFLADSHLYKQIGNSVSIPVIEKVAKKLISFLNF